MGTKDKLIERFRRQPKDFTFDEMKRLFSILGFEMNNKGTTSGSRVEFYHPQRELSYSLHKPHPDGNVKGYVMKQVLEFLEDKNLLEE